MNTWQIDFLDVLFAATDEHEVFSRIVAASKRLGFDYCSYGVQYSYNKGANVAVRNNFPLLWQTRYQEARYMMIDPTVVHCRRSETAITWAERVFSDTRRLWEEARESGLCAGWARSVLSPTGASGMLTLASPLSIATSELIDIEPQLHWLVDSCHVMLSPLLASGQLMAMDIGNQIEILTAREIEIMKWTAEGKTSRDISDILHISENTVNFHIKNVLPKLNVSNKTAAAVRAAKLGLIN